jgi:putative N6-adenine-specific DNA methylase
MSRFSRWRVGLITSDPALAEATGLPFALTAEPVLHGGLRITLYRTKALP